MLTSSGDNAHDRAMVVAAVSMSPSKCGTSFFVRVVPDVTNTKTSLFAALGSVLCC
jgi:hypothetical protein